MVKIRLSRLGAKGKIFYRVVVTDKNRKRGGKSLDVIGYWNPSKKEKQVNKEKLNYWLGKGAILTKAAKNSI